MQLTQIIWVLTSLIISLSITASEENFDTNRDLFGFLKENNTSSLENLFQFILTHDEREMIATRLALTESLLAKEKSQRQIAADLELSIALITRGSNELKRTDQKNITAIKKLLDDSC